MEKFIQHIDQATRETNKHLKKLNRNDLCYCGSGKKHKKCCLKSFATGGDTHGINIETCNVSYEPLNVCPKIEALPKKDKASVLKLPTLIRNNPKKALKKINELRSKYPDLPILSNLLYASYRKLNLPREAIEVLKKSVRSFPDYFFGRIEYAMYLLRRGEPKKANAVLNNASTLTQLYPDRTIFHVSEWVSFSFFKSVFYVDTNNLTQARIYLEMIQKLSPNSSECEFLQQKIESKLFLQAIVKH